MALVPGTQLGQYEVVSTLGAGGMGEVYRAKDTKLGREVAIKLLRDETTERPERLARFEREARVLASFNHPNIATLYGFESHEGMNFLVMELVSGETLAQRIARSSPLALDDTLEIALQIADALAEAHDHGVTHRDLKPANVMFDARGQVRVLDFGLAHMTAHVGAVTSAETKAAELTQEGRVVGTVAYMSPEQAAGRDVDTRSDLFSFGALLYEMVSGRRPFQGDSWASTLARVLEHEPPSLTDVKPDLPLELARIVRRCLRKRREERYRSTFDLVLDLTDLRQDVAAGRAAVSSAKVARRNEDEPAARQVTFSGSVRSFSMTRDGQFLAFVERQAAAGRRSLRLLDLNGGTSIELFATQGVENPGYLRWARHGAELAFLVWHTDGTVSVHVVPRLGGTARELATLDGAGAGALAWAADGRTIAAARVSEKEITLIDSRTGARREIPVPGEFLWLEDLDWSPRHERLLVLTADEGRASHLRTIAADGGSPRLLATDRIEQPRWHPDGSAVLYWRLPADGGKPTLLSIPVDPETGDALGPPRKVLIGPEDKLHWDLSEDGTRLAFTKMTMLRSNLACLTITDRGELSGEPIWLTSGTYTNRAAAISPQGEDVAFARNVGKHWNIFVASLRGGAVRRVTYGETFDSNPVWSPDGSRIAFLSQSSEGNEAASVWIVDALGGTPKRLSDRKASRGLAWAPGERLLSQSLGNRNFSLLDLEGQEHGMLIEDDSVGWAFSPKYSPDGNRVAMSWRCRDRGGLWTFPVGQGEPTLISTDDGYPAGWSNEGHLIFAMTDAVRSLRAHPSSGGQALWSLDLPFDWVLDADARCQGGTISLVVTVPEVTADAYLIEGERSLID